MSIGSTDLSSSIRKSTPLDHFNFRPARIRRRLSVVLSREEVRQGLSHLQGEYHLMASLLYGSGLRLKECLNLRQKDMDFGIPL